MSNIGDNTQVNVKPKVNGVFQSVGLKLVVNGNKDDLVISSVVDSSQ